MTRRAATVALLACLALSGVAPTGADFGASSANPDNSFAAADDWTAPSVSLSDPGSPLTASISLSATGSDDVSGLASLKLEYRPAGGTSWTEICSSSASPLSCSFNTATLATPDGVYDVRALATDNAGISSASVVVDRRIDNTAPSVTVSDPGDMSGTITLYSATGDGNGSGVGSVRYQYAAAGTTSWTDACTATAALFSCSFDTTTGSIPDGKYDLRAIASDGASLSTTSATVAAKWIDNTAPTSVTMDDPGTLLSGTKTFSGGASDSGSGVASLKFQYKLSSASSWSDACTATTSPYSCSFNTAALGDGDYDLRSLATDNAGKQTASTAYTGRKVDNNGPSVTLNDPGSHLRTNATLEATSSDGAGSGVASVKVQYRPLNDTATWTDICTDEVSPYSCTLDTTTTADGTYEFRAISTDKAGFSMTSSAVTAVIDNTKPKGVDIQTENGGQTAGRLESGDKLHLSYSETMKPATILVDWDGTATSVTVRFTDSALGDKAEVYDATNTTKLELIAGPKQINLSGDYVAAEGATFSATMVRNAATVTLTMGTLTAGAVNTALGIAETMEWPPSKYATDLAGNACQTALVLELILEEGVLDAEF